MMSLIASRWVRLGLLALGFLSSSVLTAQAHVALDAPNGGELLTSGSIFEITWHVLIQHPTQNWDLWYSTTGDTGPWIDIAMDLPAGDISQGSVHTYDWVVPDVITDEGRVRVRQDNSFTDYYDISNQNFSIVPEPGTLAALLLGGVVVLGRRR
jgi:hypothetical protein